MGIEVFSDPVAEAVEQRKKEITREKALDRKIACTSVAVEILKSRGATINPESIRKTVDSLIDNLKD